MKNEGTPSIRHPPLKNYSPQRKYSIPSWTTNLLVILAAAGVEATARKSNVTIPVAFNGFR